MKLESFKSWCVMQEPCPFAAGEASRTRQKSCSAPSKRKHKVVRHKRHLNNGDGAPAQASPCQLDEVRQLLGGSMTAARASLNRARMKANVKYRPDKASSCNTAKQQP